MKSFRNLICVAALIASVSATAGLVRVVPLPPSVTLAATMQGKDAVITWSGPVSIKAVRQYGPGMTNERLIEVGGSAKQMTLPDVKKNGEYFSLDFTDGSRLGLGCPWFTEKYPVPTLKKLTVSCDPKERNRGGLLKVIY